MKMADDSKQGEGKTAGWLMSLDALRGADMLLIMGFSGAVVALCQLLGFGKDCWLATQMSHVAWHGLRHHDTIFPRFIFLAGAAWPFSLASQQAHGRTTAQIVRKILLRVFMLWFLGLAARATFWAFDVKGLRYDTVLAHVGVVDKCEFWVSLDGKDWTKAAEGSFPDVLESRKTREVKFVKPVKARYFRFVATHALPVDDRLAVAEVDVF